MGRAAACDAGLAQKEGDAGRIRPDSQPADSCERLSSWSDLVHFQDAFWRLRADYFLWSDVDRTPVLCASDAISLPQVLFYGLAPGFSNFHFLGAHVSRVTPLPVSAHFLSVHTSCLATSCVNTLTVSAYFLFGHFLCA